MTDRLLSDEIPFECHCEDPFSSAWGKEIHRDDCLAYNQGKQAQHTVTLKAVGEWLWGRCKDQPDVTRIDCPTCMMMLAYQLKQGKMPEGE